MKRYLIFLILIGIVFDSNAKPKSVTVSVTPSESQIYVNGNYVSDGITSVEIKKNTFAVVKFVCPGYLTLETKIYKNDKREAISYVLRRDDYLDGTRETGMANQFYTLDISPDLYSKNENGAIDPSSVWKSIHHILLSYFDEILETDMNSGYILTPWKYKTFSTSGKQIRTRATVRQLNIGEDLSFQVKVSSEVASMEAPHRDDLFQKVDRIDISVEPLIEELQSRLSRK